MDKYDYSFALEKQLKPGQIIKVGVAGSGNVEVVIQPTQDLNQTTIDVYTQVLGFKSTWDEVIKRYISEYPYSGLHITLYDAGATPPVVALRLRQAIETYQAGYPQRACYTEASARNRIYSLVDEGSFKEFLLNKNTPSPTLPQLNIQVETDDGVIIGTAQFAGMNVAIASQQKDFIGGSVGEVHGAKINGLVKYAIKHKLPAIVLLIDSGGVRLQEANVGEIAISEIIRSILEARSEGINVIGVICGNNGAYGGVGIISGTLDYLIVNQGARIGVSGAEVIQAVQGIEVLDSKNRPLVWRIYGGRTRYLQNAAQAYTTDKMSNIRDSIISALKTLSYQPSLDLEQVKNEHALLQQRVNGAQNCNEEGEWVAKNRPELAEHDIFNCSDKQFLSLV
ncbi:acetyl coenzyme A carboxylase, carboxyltransferase subunit beta [Legionella beliardensis]|uniref:Malonate decarboxylase acyl carrier protein n=1 Tax=Legionella beliardensis TaxID=91822 RepID=A0A378I3L4_9GAMM|nr:biotin-independent malonate decarboxylase subunit beta [Legionella beliardensis]STX29758.1 acetyl coenzyme A carboxylase, carboxyltransferase subunit beta [Legionella beliardensis]